MQEISALASGNKDTFSEVFDIMTKFKQLWERNQSFYIKLIEPEAHETSSCLQDPGSSFSDEKPGGATIVPLPLSLSEPDQEYRFILKDKKLFKPIRRGAPKKNKRAPKVWASKNTSLAQSKQLVKKARLNASSRLSAGNSTFGERSVTKVSKRPRANKTSATKTSATKAVKRSCTS